MNWLSCAVVVYVAAGAQIALRPYIALHGATPNLLLLAAVFVAAGTHRQAALLACFAIGLLQDVLSQQPPGLHAVAFGLAAAAITAMQPAMSRTHPLTHVVMAMTAGTIVAAVTLAHGAVHGWLHGAPRPLAGPLLLGVAYTAVLAPVVLGALDRLRRFFRFRPAASCAGRLR